MESPTTANHPPYQPSPGDGWTQCRCGSKHWGLHGAAGLFLIRGHGPHTEVLLQHRALWSHQGGTWAVPGGALMPHETPLQGALREAQEEAGVPQDAVQPIGQIVLDHQDWAYTTIVGRLLLTSFTPNPADPESIEFAWANLNALTQNSADLALLPAFQEALPQLAQITQNT